LIPPERGIAVPNSSITNIPQVEITPPIIQHMSAIPTLPESLKIPLGVEKILDWVYERGFWIMKWQLTYPAPIILLTIRETAPKTPMVRSCKIFTSLMPSAFSLAECSSTG